MKTGVSFNGSHSYKEWGLSLKKVEISIPEAKTSYVDVPGMNGSLDLTEAENGGVVYEMRTLKFSFDARNCNYYDWAALLSKIANAIQGKEQKIILDTDPGYYYTGRCQVSTKKSNEVLAEVVIECTCDPFKIDIASSADPWIWDTFSFVDGIIRKTSEIAIDSQDEWKEIILNGWYYNEVLKILSSTAMQVKWNDQIFQMTSGTNMMYDIAIVEGVNKLYFRGTGTVTIIHRGGML